MPGSAIVVDPLALADFLETVMDGSVGQFPAPGGLRVRAAGSSSAFPSVSAQGMSKQNLAVYNAIQTKPCGNQAF